MNPIVSGALQSIARGLLWSLASYLVQKGYWSDSDAKLYVEGASIAVVAFLWSLYQAWKNDQLVKYLSERLHWHQWSAVRSAPSEAVTPVIITIPPMPPAKS